MNNPKLITIVAFFEDREPIKWRNIKYYPRLEKTRKALNKYGKLKYFNVYDKATKKYYERIYNF